MQTGKWTVVVTQTTINGSVVTIQATAAYRVALLTAKMDVLLSADPMSITVLTKTQNVWYVNMEIAEDLMTAIENPPS